MARKPGLGTLDTEPVQLNSLTTINLQTYYSTAIELVSNPKNNQSMKSIFTSCSAAFLSLDEALERSTFFMTYCNEQENKPTIMTKMHVNSLIKAHRIAIVSH